MKERNTRWKALFYVCKKSKISGKIAYHIFVGNTSIYYGISGTIIYSYL